MHIAKPTLMETALAVAVAAAALAALSVATGCAGGEDGPQGGGPASTDAIPAGWTEHRDAADRLSVALPPGWDRARGRLQPDVVDPVEVLSVGSSPLGPAARHDPARRCYPPIGAPVPALDRFGADDVLISIQERRRPRRGYPSRTRPFEHRRLALRRFGGTTWCAEGRVDWVAFTAFGDAGRAFYAFVVVGRDASAQRRRQLRQVIEHLRFERVSGDRSAV